MSETILYNNAKINYHDVGMGNTIVFLHGFLESLDIWSSLTKKLCCGYRLVSIDLPGFGDSDVIAETHTMEMLADSVKAVLDYLVISDCVIIGHSMGGYAGLAFAEKYPEMVKGLGLFHSHAADDDEEGKKNRDRAIEAIKKNHTGFVMDFIQGLFAPANVVRLKDQIQIMKERASAISKEAVIAAMAGMRDRPSKLDVLKKTDAPVLFIAGKEDKRVPLTKVMEQAILPKHSDILILGNVGHMGFLEADKICLRKIKNFAESCYSPRN